MAIATSIRRKKSLWLSPIFFVWGLLSNICGADLNIGAAFPYIKTRFPRLKNFVLHSFNKTSSLFLISEKSYIFRALQLLVENRVDFYHQNFLQYFYNLEGIYISLLQPCIMGAPIRSLILFLFLASTSLFKTATTHPHFDMERMPLQGRSPILVIGGIKPPGIHPPASRDGSTDFDDPCDGDSPCMLPPPEEIPAAPPVAPPPVASPLPLEVDPVDPPGNLHCQPLPFYADFELVHKANVQEAIRYFCHLNVVDPTVRDWSMRPIRRMLYELKNMKHVPYNIVYNGKHSYPDWVKPDTYNATDETTEWGKDFTRRKDVFEVKIDVVRGCKTDGLTMNPKNPLKGHDCKHLLFDAWSQCKNLGRGGSLVAGCLRYTFITMF